MPLSVIYTQAIDFQYRVKLIQYDVYRSQLANLILNENNILKNTQKQLNALSFLYSYVIRFRQISLVIHKDRQSANITLLITAECINNDYYHPTFGYYEDRIKILRTYPSNDCLLNLARELNVDVVGFDHPVALDKIEDYLLTVSAEKLIRRMTDNQS